MNLSLEILVELIFMANYFQQFEGKQVPCQTKGGSRSSFLQPGRGRMTLGKCKHIPMDLYLFTCIKYWYTKPVKFSNTAEIADGICEILFNRLNPFYDCLNNHKISAERGNIYIERVNVCASFTLHLNITKGNKITQYLMENQRASCSSGNVTVFPTRKLVRIF